MSLLAGLPVEVRQIFSDDVGGAVRLLESLRDAPDSTPIDIASFVVEVSDGLSVALAAFSSGEMVGVVTARLSGDQAWMTLLALSADWRGRGLGSLLTSDLENRLLHQGVRRIFAVAAPGRVGTAALTNQGYLPTPGMVLFEKELSFSPSEVQLIDRWGGELLTSQLWSSLAGMAREKELIDSRIVSPLANPAEAARVGLRLPQTVLLFGPPGTGKTSFARALAGRLSWPFIEVLPSKLASSEQPLAAELRSAFSELSSLDNAVVFIDEFEELAPARESSPHSAGVVNELLKSIPIFRSRRGKLLVCATNFVSRIDPAVLRPGRFDLLIGIGPPDADALTALWVQALASLGLDSDVDVQLLVRSSSGFTPGDVDLAAQRAAAAAFRRSLDGGQPLVTVDDLLSAVSATVPSIAPSAFDSHAADVRAFERV